MKLIQKHLIKGSREFELVDNRVKVRIKPRFKTAETFTVPLTILNPEPVINQQYLEFQSRARNETQFSLFLNKPNAEQFKAFADVVKQRAEKEYNTLIRMQKASQFSAGLSSAKEAGEDQASQKLDAFSRLRPVDIAKLDSSIQMLKKYQDSHEIQPLIAALETLKAEPENESHLRQAVNVFNGLGFKQGAVLTYAPYISSLLRLN